MLFFPDKDIGRTISYIVNGLPKMIDAQHLPIILPEVENIYQQKTDYRL
jgi:hypothetical protein